MRQYKLCIQIIIIIVIKKNKKIKIKRKGQTISEDREERGRIFFFFSSFLSQIYGNWTVDFCQSKRQSWTTQRELRIGTNILAFLKLQEVGNFPTCVISSLKAM